MTQPLMPIATATWLVENTSLTFKQIAQYTNLSQFEIQSIADGEPNMGIQALDPILTGQLTRDEITRCEENNDAELAGNKNEIVTTRARPRSPRYTPISKRGDKPDAIAWLVKHYPNLSNAQIIRLVGTTKNTIAAIRTRTHWNMTNIRPRSPAEIGFCSQPELQTETDKIAEVKTETDTSSEVKTETE